MYKIRGLLEFLLHAESDYNTKATGALPMGRCHPRHSIVCRCLKIRMFLFYLAVQSSHPGESHQPKASECITTPPLQTIHNESSV